MVYIPPRTSGCRLNAYQTTSLSPSDLAKVKKSFERGSWDGAWLELIIKDEPSYHQKSHADIRRAEDAAGRMDPFIIIDDRAALDDAVWYIDTFASEEDVKDGAAESTSTLMKIRTKTDCLALTWVNYDVGNMSITEDLDSCGVEFPMSEEFEQKELQDCGGMDMREQQRHMDAYITAEPGEFEESTDEELRKNFLPRPERVARLKADLAKENGLLSGWTSFWDARPVILSDGTQKTFPEGSVQMCCQYDPDFPWPEYKWPEGSL